MTLGYFLQMQWSETRAKLQEYKDIRELGYCLLTEQQKEKILIEKNKFKQEQVGNFTVQAMIDRYLRE